MRFRSPYLTIYEPIIGKAEPAALAPGLAVTLVFPITCGNFSPGTAARFGSQTIDEYKRGIKGR